MAGRVYVRDIEILRRLDEGLSKFNYGATSVLEQVARSIKASQEHLRARKNFWQAELRRREAALNACESAQDKDGRGYNCSAEAAAVREAYEALEKLRRLSSRLEQTIGEYTPYANRLQQLLNTRLNKAKGDLTRSEKKYRSYLSQSGLNSGNVGGTSLSSVDRPKISSSSTVKSLVNKLQNALPSGSKGYITMAVGLVEDEHGNKQNVVATSEPRGYIRPGVKEIIPSGAIIVEGEGHAEENIVNWAQQSGKKVLTVGAGRPICSKCERKLTEVGSEFATPLKDT